MTSEVLVSFHTKLKWHESPAAIQTTPLEQNDDVHRGEQQKTEIDQDPPKERPIFAAKIATTYGIPVSGNNQVHIQNEQRRPGNISHALFTPYTTFHRRQFALCEEHAGTQQEQDQIAVALVWFVTYKYLSLMTRGTSHWSFVSLVC